MSSFLLASTKQPSVLRNDLRQEPLDSQVLSRTSSKELTHSRDVFGYLKISLGARFTKVPKTFRARKVIRKTPTRLFCKAGLFICCKGMEK